MLVRYRLLDMTSGLSGLGSIGFEEIYRDGADWVEAFSPSYQGDYQAQHRASVCWWTINSERLVKGMPFLPKSEWPNRLD